MNYSLEKGFETAIKIRKEVNSKENIPGIDLNEVAKVVEKKIGKKVNLYLNYLDDIKEKYHIYVSGYIKGNENEIDVYVNPKETASYQRFIIARELGHLLLHNEKEPTQNGRILFRIECNSLQDREANAFASELLMSTDWTIKMHESDYDSYEIADAFDVSPSAVRTKIQKMYAKRE